MNGGTKLVCSFRNYFFCFCRLKLNEHLGKLAHIYHPDKNSNPIYFEQFKQIKKAYEILGKYNFQKIIRSKSIQLEGKSTKSRTLYCKMHKNLLQYFHLLEREMQQTDFQIY
jgi:hypothetical protein